MNVYLLSALLVLVVIASTPGVVAPCLGPLDTSVEEVVDSPMESDQEINKRESYNSRAFPMPECTKEKCDEACKAKDPIFNKQTGFCPYPAVCNCGTIVLQ